VYLSSVRRSEFGLGGEGEEGFMLCNSFIIAGLLDLSPFPVLSAHVCLFVFSCLSLFSRVFRRDSTYNDLLSFQIIGVEWKALFAVNVQLRRM